MTLSRTNDGPGIVTVSAVPLPDGRCRMCGERWCAGTHFAAQDSPELGDLRRRLGAHSASSTRALTGGGRLHSPAAPGELQVERDRWRAELGTTWSPYRVRLRERERSELLDAAAAWDGDEAGAWLIGRCDQRGIEVTWIHTGSFAGERSSDAIRLAPPPFALAQGWGDLVVGSMHTHVDSSQPSDDDVRVWAERLSAFAALGLSRYVGVIATPRYTVPVVDFWPATFHAFIARRDGGITVVEPAEIEEED